MKITTLLVKILDEMESCDSHTVKVEKSFVFIIFNYPGDELITYKIRRSFYDQALSAFFTTTKQ
jgi:hypothetical protein